MPKSPSPFTGMKLTEQTPLAESGPDQKLFSHSTSQDVPARPKRPEPTKEPNNLATLQTRKQATLEPRNLGNLELAASEALEFDLNITPYKNDTFAFTTEELEAIEDIKTELRRRLDLQATKNDIVRCGIHSIVDDYRRRGAESLIVQRIRNKRAR
jgi:hypothetical protein